MRAVAPNRSAHRKALVALVTASLTAIPARGSESTGGAAPAEGEAPEHEESLAGEVIDLTAPLLQMRFQYALSGSFYAAEGGEDEEDGTAQRFILKPAVPFWTWGVLNNARLVIPYETKPREGRARLGEVEARDLVIWPVAERFRIGVGPVASFSPDEGGEEDEEATFAIGPAAGFVVTPGEWTFGFLNQNFFTGDSARALFEPVVAYDFNHWLGISLGELEFVFDYDEGRFETLPIGLQLNVVPTVFKQPIRFEANPQWNLKDEPETAKYTLLFGIAFLVRAEPPERGPSPR